MSKQKTRTNYRIEIKILHQFGSRIDPSDYVEMVRQIRRHVDNGQHAEILSDEVAVCSHCGAYWTEADDDYNGGCCTPDQEEHDRSEVHHG